MRGRGLILILLILTSCATHGAPAMIGQQEAVPTAQTRDVPMEFTKERVEFVASDGIALVGNFYDATNESGLILLHQYGLDKESWDAFARRLQRSGYASLAVDLRGHGESQGNYATFSDRDFIAMLLDAEAAAAFLRSKHKDVVAILGASIGANTAFKYGSQQKIPNVLFSPGLEYKGIDINTVTSTAPTLIVVGKRDTYSYDSSVELDTNNLHGNHELVVLDTDKHGTFLLDEPGVQDKVLAFLDAQE